MNSQSRRLHCAPRPPLGLPADWIESQGEDPAALPHERLAQLAASDTGNWRRAFNLYNGAPVLLPAAGRRHAHASGLC